MCYVYILYSSSLNRHYIGSTELDPIERLELHLTKFYGVTKYTASASDWKIKLTLQCHNIIHARKVEGHIKRMKSSKYINDLLKHTELKEKLLNRYRGSSR